MPKLPVISGKKALKAFRKAGWHFDHQRGSHVVLAKPGNPNILTVPMHDELDRGTLRHLIDAAGMTVDQFCQFL